MSYHVSRQGRSLGVATLEDIRAKLARGELLADDLAWTAGMSDWLPLGDITSATPPPAPPPPSPPAPATPTPPTPAAATDTEASSASRPPIISPGSAKHRGRSRRRSKPANHLVGAILVTLFCCLPLGVVAIVYASQVDEKYRSGDHFGAREAAHKAKNWMWIAFAFGLISIFAYAALALAGGIMSV